MTEIRNSLSFNNKVFDVSNSSAANPNSIRSKFAESLKNAASDKNITEDELKNLQQIAQDQGTDAEKEIVLQLSKGGTAAFDPDANGPIEPVQITFAKPKESATTGANQTGNIGTGNKTTSTGITFPDTGRTFNVSPEIISYLNNSALTESRNPRISYKEFEDLMNIAKTTNNPADLEFVKRLADMAITRIDTRDKTFPLQMPGGKQINIRVDTQPPPQKNGETTKPNFKTFVQGIITGAEQALEDKARITLGFRPIVKPFTLNPVPTTGFTFTPHTGVDGSGRFNGGFSIGAGVKITPGITVGGTVDYNVPLFRVPGGSFGRAVFGGSRTGQTESGFSATALLRIGDNAQFSYNTQTGFGIASNFDLDKKKGTFFAFGYNQPGQERGSFSFGIGKRF